eukprot:5844785-Pleurochrysis_carterae.AAC.2
MILLAKRYAISFVRSHIRAQMPALPFESAFSHKEALSTHCCTLLRSAGWALPLSLFAQGEAPVVPARDGRDGRRRHHGG